MSTLHSELSTRQPKSFYVLFMVELWERFGYYGMTALLVLYMTKSLLFGDQHAYASFAAFASLVYISPLLGGYISDKYLGFQRAIILGAGLLTVGYALLAVPNDIVLYPALGIIAIANGIFKTGPSSLLGKVYGPDDPRVESGFTLFYMSINIGSLISMLSMGYVAHLLGWHVAFGACSAGMFLGLLTFLRFRYLVAGVGAKADKEPLVKRYVLPILLVIAAAMVLAAFLIAQTKLAEWSIAVGGVLLLGFYALKLPQLESIERRKLIGCLVLIVFSVAFTMLYFQPPMTLSLFVDRNVDKHVFGLFVPAASYQSLNSFWILVLAPILAFLFNHLIRNDRNPTMAAKFPLGIIIMGFGFLLLTVSTYFANADGLVSTWWVVASYFLQSLAEMFVGALGPAMAAQLAPPKMLGMVMGTWFYGIALAATIAGKLADLASVSGQVTDAHATLGLYGHVFAVYGGLSVAVGLLTLLFAPWVKRLITS